MRKDHAAQRTDQESQGKGGQRHHLTHQRVVAGKELLGKNDGRHGSVQEIVVPLDGATHGAAHERAAALGFRNQGFFIGSRKSWAVDG
ncbi:hypothetical protein G6F21_014265 [Rhizopus arrhizus]|nr:hypothetical protein G6F21_014265 [Rhizopus arrhizus]